MKKLETTKNGNQNGESLENVSGGANLKTKIASGVLAPIMALSGASALSKSESKTDASLASSQTQSSASESLSLKAGKLAKDLKEKFINFKNENPKLVKAGMGVGIGAGAVGATAIGATVLGLGGAGLAKLGLSIYLKDVETRVDNMSKSELSEFLDKQIKDFEQREGGNAFIVSDKLKSKNKKLLALSLSSLNAILDRFPQYAEFLAKYNVARKHKFELGIIPESVFTNIKTYGRLPIAYAKGDMSGIYVADYMMLSKDLTMALGKKLVKTGLRSDLKLSEIVEGALSHEMGHIIEFCIMCTSIKSVNEIKREIIAKAKEINPSFNGIEDSFISKYGETNDGEWFAEVFSNMMNGTKPTTLTDAMKEYVGKITLNY